jgi:hypothetical protein
MRENGPTRRAQIDRPANKVLQHPIADGRPEGSLWRSLVNTGAFSWPGAKRLDVSNEDSPHRP